MRAVVLVVGVMVGIMLDVMGEDLFGHELPITMIEHPTLSREFREVYYQLW